MSAVHTPCQGRGGVPVDRTAVRPRRAKLAARVAAAHPYRSNMALDPIRLAPLSIKCDGPAVSKAIPGTSKSTGT